MLLPFFEGIIATIGALILEISPSIFGMNFSETSLFFILFTACVEEIVKYAFILNRYLKLEAKEKILSGAFFLGLGFASIDIFLKQLDYAKNMFLPIAGVFLVHLVTATLLGIFFRKNGQRKIILVLVILILNILLHFSYNLLILRYF